MAASKKLVFIKSINDKTWLLLTKKPSGTCLRDYSRRPFTEDRSHSVEEIEHLLKQCGNYFEHLPAFSKVPYSDEQFWREEIEIRNVELGLSKSLDERRLQDRFKKKCQYAIQRRKKAALRSLFQGWIKRFDCVKDKVQFNPWDNSSPASKYPLTMGIGWTSQLLDACRRDGVVRYISTGCRTTEFSLAAMELSLGISSKNNAFAPGRRDYIKPDGLALRKSGYFTVIEVKGPQDEADLISPMLQATCGALAVFAKRAMLQRIALQPAKQRPRYSRAEIPVQSRTMGIHVLTHAKDDGSPRKKWSVQEEEACHAVLEAFEQLQYIAYSFVTKKQAINLTEIRTNVLITTEGVTFPYDWRQNK